MKKGEIKEAEGVVVVVVVDDQSHHLFHIESRTLTRSRAFHSSSADGSPLALPHSGYTSNCFYFLLPHPFGLLLFLFFYPRLLLLET